MDTSGHYDVLKNPAWPMGNGYIKALRCAHCQFSVSLFNYKKPGDKGGQAKYNRARAVMVKHLHDAHRKEMGGDQ